MRFMPGDYVRYQGAKFSTELRGKIGEVISQVQNVPEMLVVEFEVYKEGPRTFTLHYSNLKLTKHDDGGLQKNRRFDEEFTEQAPTQKFGAKPKTKSKKPKKGTANV